MSEGFRADNPATMEGVVGIFRDGLTNKTYWLGADESAVSSSGGVGLMLYMVHNLFIIRQEI